jgi:hypothetical protein
MIGFNRESPRKDEYEKIENRIEDILQAVENLSQKLRLEGFPVGKDLRIQIEDFSDIYSLENVNHDQKLAEAKYKEFQEKSHHEKLVFKMRERFLNIGELLEITKTFLFNKYLQKDFITIRSSFYDDYINQIDNVIIDRNSGKVVCAIDETSAMQGNIYEEKRERILEKNRRGGVRLKYGVSLKDNNPTLGDFEGLLYLYLPLEKKYLLQLVKDINIDLDPSKTSEIEVGVLIYFLTIIQQQISILRIDNKIKSDWDFIEGVEKIVSRYLNQLQKLAVELRINKKNKKI